MKKVFATLLALALALTLCASAMAVTITIDPKTNEDVGTTYTAYKIFDATISGENVSYTIDEDNPFYTTILNSGFFTLTQVNETSTYIVKATEAYSSKEAAKVLAEQLKAVVSADAVAGISTYVNGNYEIEVQGDGYYLVTSTVGSALILDTSNSTDIEEKNEYPSLVKTANVETADMGAIVTFTITVKIPATAEGQIVVHDKMTGLAYQAMTTEIGGVTAITEGLEDGCTVHFELSETLVQENRGETVVIEYTAKVTADTANNEAFLENNDFESKPGTVDIKNYKFDVFKYKKVGEDEQGLAGAGFVLMNKDGAYYKATYGEDGNVVSVSWVDNINDATELMPTEANGYTVTFAGLANGTYTLIEKTVPAGYNPAENTQVVINGANLENPVKVLNATGSELPSTGGIGTTIFYVVGGLMMFGALVLLITKKKVSAK